MKKCSKFRILTSVKEMEWNKSNPYLMSAVKGNSQLVRVCYVYDTGLNHLLCQGDGVEGEEQAADHYFAPEHQQQQ